MNLAHLGKSHHAPMPGDWFLYKVVGHGYRYGRVIELDTRIGAMVNDPHTKLGLPVLVYLYAPQHDSIDSDRIPAMRASDLLTPPLGVFQRLWSEGYFQHANNAPLSKSDRLTRHCFHDSLTNRYVDQYGKQLSRKSEPCGTYVACFEGGVSDEVSLALGLPFVE